MLSNPPIPFFVCSISLTPLSVCLCFSLVPAPALAVVRNHVKFDSRLFMCRELYQEYMDFGPREIPKSKDPFWDPPEVRQGHSNPGQGMRVRRRIEFLFCCWY